MDVGQTRCVYQRGGYFYSATERLLHDRGDNTAASPPGSLEACAEQVMRPL